jgi:hypothetical protein
MKGDRVTVRILCDEEATEGAIGKRGEDDAASLDERIVQHAGVVAGDPEHHAYAKWRKLSLGTALIGSATTSKLRNIV